MEKKESNKLEYKERVPDKFLKTVSAYANYYAGEIIFGVNVNREGVGIDNLADTRVQIENKINDNLKPVPTFRIVTDEERRIIILTVLEGKEKPYMYLNKAYKRSDTSTVAVDQSELKRLIMAGSNQTFESQPSSADIPQFEILEKELQEKIKKLTKDILKTLELFSEEAGYNNAAELLADSNTFPGIDLAIFGESINEFKYRQLTAGVSILEQLIKPWRLSSRIMYMKLSRGPFEK